MIIRRNHWKITLRRGIALLLLFCLFTGLLPPWAMAETAQEQSMGATRAAAEDYISIAASLAKPLVLNRRVDPNLTVAEIRAIDDAHYIVVYRDKVVSSFYAIDPCRVSNNTMQSTKVDVHVANSETFAEGTLSNSPQYIKNLDPAVAEKLAMTFRYAGDPNGAVNGYLTDVGGDGYNTASFAFRVTRSDGAEMQFSDGGEGIESFNRTANIELMFSSTQTERPTVRLYRRIRDTSASPQEPGSFSFQCNAMNGHSIKNTVLKFQTPSGQTPYTQLYSSSAANGGGDRSTYFLYEYFGEEVAYLYTAITEAAAYLQKVVNAEPDSANTQAFIAAFEAAVTTYNKYNVLPMPEDNGTDPGEEMTKAAENLIAFYSFIDIPVEILDFRSDLYLMEYERDYFGLVHDFDSKPDDFRTSEGGLTLPGQIQLSSQGVPHFRTGLMEKTLHNGYPMYDEQVVEFVAKLLYYKRNEEDMYNDELTKRFGLLKEHDVDWNMTFYNLLRGKPVLLGNLNSVLAQTNGGSYGDSLDWSKTDRNSCYALAYYMLTNLWRPVTDTGPDAYNTSVPERNSLRLFKDIDGAYTIDANQIISYGSYMGNVMPRVDRSLTTWQAPCFTPIDGLGFEKNGNETDLSPTVDEGYKETNYNFTMHAHGSFVYYKDQDLFFEFKGDDDVFFYVNNTMALDIGGTHTAATGRVDLNDKADTLGLVDGEVYTFDMFYAERRIAGSNLKFSTNIKIVDTDTLTTKGQYLDTQSGKSMVNPTTGKGAELIDYAPINVGDTVAYSFDLQNTRDVPLKQLSFADATLGVTASHAVLTLNSATTINDLRLYYATIEEGTLDSSTPAAKTEAEMQKLLEKANVSVNGIYGSLPGGSYRVDITSQAMLKELLHLGVPVNCKLSLYGFKRVVQDDDQPYINTVISECLTYDNKVVTGTASRVITAFVAPEGKDTSYVLDYGKSVQIPVADLKSSITVVSGSSVGNCVGLTTAGTYSGQLLKTLPSTASPCQGKYGSFALSNSVITYTPNKLLSGTDSVFAVFDITGCTVIEDGGKTVKYPYILLQLCAIPANRMYYEAEDFTETEISYVQKSTDENTKEVSYDTTWDTKGQKLTTTQDTDLVGGGEIRIPDYSQEKNVLFFGFDKTSADEERYKLSQYKKTNFDTSRWYGGSSSFVQSATIKNGVLTIVPKTGIQKSAYDNGKGSTSLYADCSYNGYTDSNKTARALDYNPTGAEVLQVRFKMKNLDTKYNEAGNKTIPYLGLHLWCAAKDSDEQFKNSDGDYAAARCIGNYTYDPSILTADEYVTWTIPLGNQFNGIGTVWGMRTYFGNLLGDQTKSGYLMIDYIYMGPADMAPYRETYGYDTSYEEVTKLSNGGSLYTEGNGVPTPANPDPANYTQTQFSFTGTGFDLISCTGPAQGTIRVEVFDNAACADKNRVATATVNLKGEQDMYQIPVYSKEDLPHGTYWVKVSVNKKVENSAFEILNRGNQFYLDSIIIYDPIDTTADAGTSVLRAYEADGEAYPVVKEIRDILLSAKDFDELGKSVNGTVTGAVFVDYAKVPEVIVPTANAEGETTSATENVTDPSLNITDHITSSIVTYEKVGPKNEVYLSPQEAIAFKMVISSQELPHRIDVGCKAIMDPGGILKVQTANGSGRSTGIFSRPLSGGSVRYFSLPLCREVFAEETIDGKPCYTTYIVIRNDGVKSTANKNAVLSITDIKIAYAQEPTPLDTATEQASAVQETGAKRTTTLSEDVELPTDNFEPVRFVVDVNTHDVVNSVLQEPETPEEEELTEAEIADLAFAGASVSLQSDLAIHFKVNETVFTEMGYRDPYVVIRDNGTEIILRDYQVKDGKYAFIYRNIAPHRIGDTVTATLYAYYGDVLYCSESRDYSVADYCYNMLGKTEGIAAYEKLRTLLVDILLYGAKTQEYMSYRLDSLCTARLTEAQLACGTEVCRELVNHRDQAVETIDNPTVQWKGAGLNLRESVAIRFKLEAESYEDLEVRITLAGKTYSIYAKDFDHREEGTYVHFCSLNAAQMSEPVYAAVYRNGEQVSHTICYSIESYAYAKQNDTIPHLADLVRRMMCYGDSTKAYVMSTESVS